MPEQNRVIFFIKGRKVHQHRRVLRHTMQQQHRNCAWQIALTGGDDTIIVQTRYNVAYRKWQRERLLKFWPAADSQSLIIMLMYKISESLVHARVHIKQFQSRCVRARAQWFLRLHLDTDIRITIGQGSPRDLIKFMQPVDAQAVKTPQKLTFVKIKIIEARSDSANERCFRCIHQLDCRQCMNRDGKPLRKQFILRISVKPLDGNIPILEIVANDSAVHIDAAERIEWYRAAFCAFRDSPEAKPDSGSRVHWGNCAC